MAPSDLFRQLEQATGDTDGRPCKRENKCRASQTPVTQLRLGGVVDPNNNGSKNRWVSLIYSFYVPPFRTPSCTTSPALLHPSFSPTGPTIIHPSLSWRGGGGYVTDATTQITYKQVAVAGIGGVTPFPGNLRQVLNNLKEPN